jgi:neural Wiskott-Aldrich syndrome protein
MTDDARIQRWLATHRNAVGAHPSSEHVDMDTLARHAAGQLSAGKARIVTEHLLVCEDGRCGDFVRSQATDMDGVAELLYPPTPAQPAEPAQQPRTFQSREIVWNTFESMARELDVPIDHLVNEAMAGYARARGYTQSSPTGGDRPTPRVAMPLPGAPPPAPAPKAPPPMAQPPVPMTPAFANVLVSREAPTITRSHGGAIIRELPTGRDPLDETHDAQISPLDRSYSPARAPMDVDDEDLARTGARPQMSPPAPPNRPSPGARRASPAPVREREREPIVPQTQRIPLAGAGGPPHPSTRGSAAPYRSPGTTAGRQLVLSYRGQQFVVDKDRYLLGRSKTQADLRLDDPNVSRQHAAIERVGSAWYIVDLGSTNGVQMGGERVARRALVDGDVITITSHEILCSLR